MKKSFFLNFFPFVPADASDEICNFADAFEFTCSEVKGDSAEAGGEDRARQTD